MNGNLIDPLPGYILDINREFPPGYVSRTRRKRNAAIAEKKKKLAKGLASGKVKMDKPSVEYDTVDEFGRAVHVEWRGGCSFYSNAYPRHN